jgi:hypothetical protein
VPTPPPAPTPPTRRTALRSLGALGALALAAAGGSVGPVAPGTARAQAVPGPAPRPAGQFVYGAWLADPASTAPKAKEAGLTHMAAHVAWSQVEPSKGRYLFKEKTSWGEPVANDLTNVINAAKKAGLKVVLRVGAPPAWAGGAVHQLNPDDVQNYVREAVTYGKGTIAFVGAFNELNLPFEWGASPVNPAAAARLQKAVYDGAKAADPDVRVVAPAVAPRTGGYGGTMEDTEWLDAFYSAGATEHFHLQGMNAYLGGFAPDADPACAPMCFRTIELQRKVMDERGVGAKPVLLTELGVLEQTAQDLGPYEWMELPADRRAEHLVGALRLAHDSYPWIAGAILFNLDYASVPWVPPTSAMHWFSLLNPDRSPRPAYARLREARASGVLS